jgi:phage major head subunit gpT-like protein
MREWIKERLIHQPNALDLQITNRKFENTLNLPLDLVNNDKIGQVHILMSDFANTYGLWIYELLAAAVNLMVTANAFDGQAFFSASHNWAKTGTFSNLFNSATTGTPTAVTALEAALAINKGIETHKGLPDDQGRVIKNETMTEVVLVYQAGTVNASAIRTALSTVNGGLLSSGTGTATNPLMGQDVRIKAVGSGLVNLGATTKFALFRSRADGGKALIFQENKQERMVSMVTDANSEYVVKNDGWLVGLKTVGNCGFGLPNDAVLGTFV